MFDASLDTSLAGGPTTGQDIEALGHLFAKLDTARRRLEAQLATVVNEVERRGLHALDGHATVKGWCRALGRWSTAEARSSARVGRLLHASPAVAEAASAGVLGVAQLQALARGFANPRCGDQLLLVIGLLIEHAQQLSFDEFNLVMRRWEMLADADGSFSDHEAAHRGRTASVQVSEGAVDIRARGGSAHGVSIKEIFQRYVDAEFELDWSATVAQHGDSACPADAQPPEPVVNIITTLDTLEAAVVRATGATQDSRRQHPRHHHPRPTSPSEDPWRWRAETTNGDLLSPNDILAAALIGHVRRVVVDSAGVIIDLGRKRRLFTGNQRDAVLMGSARCIWPGCAQPSGRCQADHLHEWQHNGCTNIANAAPLCAHHNRWKARGYATARDANGYWHTYRPNGTEIA